MTFSNSLSNWLASNCWRARKYVKKDVVKIRVLDCADEGVRLRVVIACGAKGDATQATLTIAPGGEISFSSTVNLAIVHEERVPPGEAARFLMVECLEYEEQLQG